MAYNTETPTPTRLVLPRFGMDSAMHYGRIRHRRRRAPYLHSLHDTFKQVYLHGHKNPENISPDNWNMDFRFMERPTVRQGQMDLFYDYRTNVSLYPQWQKFLRECQPKALIFWGQNEIFFTREGGEAYLRDLPNTEMYRLDSGHFAIEDCLNEIANNISRFYFERVFIRPA